MRTIRVEGKGEIKLRPDMTFITVTLTGISPEYGETVKKSSGDAVKIKELIAGFGFERSDLKTLSFGVDIENEGYEENGIYKQRFKGFRYRHVLKLEFPSDNDMLGKVLCALANSDLKPELDIGYTVSDPEAAKKALIASAVADAKEKAEILADAADVRLKFIRSINYSRSPHGFTARGMNIPTDRSRKASPLMAAKESFEVDVEPDDITESDSVSIIWEIG